MIEIRGFLPIIDRRGLLIGHLFLSARHRREDKHLRVPLIETFACEVDPERQSETFDMIVLEIRHVLLRVARDTPNPRFLGADYLVEQTVRHYVADTGAIAALAKYKYFCPYFGD